MDQIAVIDIGSNSARTIVVRVLGGAHLEILSDARQSLQLARHVDGEGRLSDEAVTRTVAAIRDFQGIAAANGVERTVAVATAAIRDASNRSAVVERIRRETGQEVAVIDGDTEARLAFVGAVQSLPVHDGMVVDVGGGSLEISSFRRRRLVDTWTLPLGALRATDAFLTTDPPKPGAVEELRLHAADALASAGVPALRAGQSLVGTGGTIRNLAKVNLSATGHAIPRIHGYTMSRRRMRDVTAQMVSRPLRRRVATPGLSADRADSITGGAVVTQTVMEVLGAAEITVSGQGLREGVAIDSLRSAPPSPAQVRHASVTALAARFSTWDRRRAQRRSRLASEILDLADPSTTAEMRTTVEDAAALLDIGRSVDYYERWTHAASIIVASDLQGLSHHDIALLAATVERAAKGRARLRRYARLLDEASMRAVDAAATALAVADELERRLAPDGGEVHLRHHGAAVVARTTQPHPGLPADLLTRFKRTFARQLLLENGARP